MEIVSTGGTSRELAARRASRCARSRTSPAFPRSWTGASRRCTRGCMRACSRAATTTQHLRAAAEQGIEPVDLVCVNLYPFEQTLARGDATDEEIIENIDIGGPTMIRAAAKNSAFAAVVVDPSDYQRGARASCATPIAALVARDAHRARGQGVRVHRPLRRVRSRRGSRRARATASPRAGTTPTRRSATCATARTPTSRPRSTRAPARRRICSPASSSCTARSCRSTTCSTSARRASWSRSSPSRPARSSSTTTRAAARSRERPGGLRTRLRVRPAERLRRRDRRQPARRLARSQRSSASSSSRCCSRPATTPPRWTLLQVKKNVRLLELSDWPEPSNEVEAKPVIGGQLVQTRDVDLRDTRADARDERARSRARRVAGRCCSRGRSAATCAPTRS